MGILISKLDPQQLDSYLRSVDDLIRVIRQEDSTLAQLIEHVTKSRDPVPSESDLQEIARHVKSTAACSDRSSNWRTNDETSQLSKPASQHKYFLAFKIKFEQRQPGIQSVLRQRLEQWQGNPLSFWGRVDSLSQMTLPAAIRRLHAYIESFEDESIVSPMRRRLSLSRLNRFREDVESRVQYLAQKSRLKVKKGATYKSISMSVVSTLTGKSEEKVELARLVTRLRAGERYSRLPTGMLLALGNVPSDGMEKCPPDDFELIEQYCKAFSPDWIVRLGQIATVLKKTIWDDKLDMMELDAIIELHVSQSHRTSARASRTSRKRKREGHSSRPSKKTYQSAPKHTAPVARSQDVQQHASKTADGARPTPTTSNRTPNICGTADGRMEELLVAAGLRASPRQDQCRPHCSQETTALPGSPNRYHITPTIGVSTQRPCNENPPRSTMPCTDTTNLYGVQPGLRDSNSSQESTSISQGHDSENDTRQINSGSIEFDQSTYNFDRERITSPLSGIGQDAVVVFHDDPAAMRRLSIGQRLRFDFIDDPAALPSMDQEFAFDFIDDPAALQSIGQEFAFDFNDDPAALPGLDQELTFGFSGNPSATSMHRRISFH